MYNVTINNNCGNATWMVSLGAGQSMNLTVDSEQMLVSLAPSSPDSGFQYTIDTCSPIKLSPPITQFTIPIPPPVCSDGDVSNVNVTIGDAQ
jgi:hypothetical protein